MSIINVLWGFITYFLVMAARAWFTSLLAGSTETARYYNQETRAYLTAACGAFVAWLWLGGYGR